MPMSAPARLTTVFRTPIEHHGTLRLGIISVLVIVVTLGGLLGVQRLGLGKTTYDADFAQAAGLSAGDQVTVAGVHVGSVKGLRLAGDKVVVTLEVDRNVHLGAASRAGIKLTTLLGARYVELKPAGSGELTDKRIPLANTEVPYTLQDSLQDATTTFEAVDAEKIAQSMTSLSEQLQGSPEILPQALDNVAHLSSVLAGRRDEIGDLLRSTQQIAELLGGQQRSLATLMTQGRDVLTDLAARKQMIVRLVDATTTLVNQLQPVLVGDRAQMDALLTNLDGILASVGKNDALFRNTLQMMPVPLRNFTNATGNGNEFDFSSSGGTLIDSVMCALSGRAEQFNLPNYFEDCR
ncbi:putative MCE family protein [Mycolicibacterium vaccae ATCC 25954]|uniref:Putative MCE family protein n=2 Tax=Mycolicibacterium vaccae TaxID=1810 RepID=K0V4I2_MYCVA|nr:mammalian cell entry protein [Mycolicibacterium vaccae 95051]EJZ12385.1 putative MCE family protein [Mycolicibacterium vaccae ATCC 25954]